jgi:hypothetical protein
MIRMIHNRIRTAAVLVGAGSMVFAVSACSTQSGAREFAVYQPPPTLADHPDPDFDRKMTGAVLFFAADLTDEEGDAVGRVMGQVTTIDVTLDDQPEEDRFREIIFNLRDGQIIALGASEYVATGDLQPDFADSNAPVTAVVVGGTQEYLGARGTVTTTKLEDGTFEHDFQLQE